MKPLPSLVLLLIFTTFGCAAGLRLIKQDELVRIFARDSILPHGYGDQILEFKGKRYHRLAGPGYVRVPGKDLIAFATSRDGSRMTLHLVPIGKGEEFEIDLRDTGFGSGLGYPKDDPASHYIENIEGDKITFVAMAWNAPKGVRFTLDLKGRTFLQLPESEGKASSAAK